jgi:hypothetical protein
MARPQAVAKQQELVVSAGGQGEAQDETGNGNGHQEFAHGEISPSRGETLPTRMRRELIWISGVRFFWSPSRPGK